MRILAIEAAPLHLLRYMDTGPTGGLQPRTLPIHAGIVDALPAGLEALLIASDLQGREEPARRRQGTPARQPAGEESRLLGERLADELSALAAAGCIPALDHTAAVLAGDLYARQAGQGRGGAGDVLPVYCVLAERLRWVAGVAGNHDRFGEHAALPPAGSIAPNVHLLNRGVIRVEPALTIAGLSGIIGDPGRPWRREEEAYVLELWDVLAATPEMVVLHEGPDVPAAAMPGNPVIRAALAERAPARPLLVVCGHSHSPTVLAELPGAVQVLNVDHRAVLLRPAG